MAGAPTLLTGRITRRAMAWLVGAVLLVTPLEAFAYDNPIVSGTLPLRAGFLLLILLGLRTIRITAVEAGQLFLTQALLCMVSWSVLLDLDPNRIALQTLAYGTILPVCTLLIAPKATRRPWAFLVFCVTLYPAIARLMPENLALLAQVVATLLVHGASVAALDAHADKAELAGEMADIDPLTGLLNRRAALSALNQSADGLTEQQRAAALVLLDLDHFKQLNDTLGHEAGDDALRRVAQVLTAFVRPSDHVCRWGGEEFLVVLPGADEASAVGAAERLRLRLVDAGVTASFGVAEFEAGDSVTSWVRRADDAMYVAKHEGRNTVRLAERASHVPI
jgi:diguanylate cyclase (GGDEF)-like protein